MTEIRQFQLSELQEHPWQVNVPNIDGKEWTEFRADVESRGIQEPIRVSLRTGVPVIVDGHQRVRAAREVGYSVIIGIENVFADEGEEVKFLSSAAQFRRQLTVLQRAAIGAAREAYFSAMAAERKTGRPKKGQDKLGPSGPDFSPTPLRAAKQAAEAVGLSENTYKRAKAVLESPVAEVIKPAIDSGEMSISAGAELAKRGGTTIHQAMIDGHLNAIQAAEINRTADLKRAVESGEKTPAQAVSMYEAMKAASDRDDKERGTALCIKMEGLLTQIEDATQGDFYAKVLGSRYNAEEWGGDFAVRWQRIIRQMQDVARRAEVQSRTLDMDAAD